MARKCKSRHDHLAFLLGAMPYGLLLSHAHGFARAAAYAHARPRACAKPSEHLLFFSPGFLRQRNTIKNIIIYSQFASNKRCDNR